MCVCVYVLLLQWIRLYRGGTDADDNCAIYKTHFTAEDLEKTGTELCKALAAYVAEHDHGWELEENVRPAIRQALLRSLDTRLAHLISSVCILDMRTGACVSICASACPRFVYAKRFVDAIEMCSPCRGCCCPATDRRLAPAYLTSTTKA